MTFLIHFRRQLFPGILRPLAYSTTSTIKMPKRKSDVSDEKPEEENAKKQQKSEANGITESLEENIAEGVPTRTSTADGRSPNLKITCWNVAGLKACVKKDMVGYLKKEDADIVCLQETKCTEADLPGEVKALGTGAFFKKADAGSSYHMYWCSGEKKGYAGVALWSKKKPISVKNGLGISEHDTEGRLITAEFDNFYVITAYVPNAGKKLVRLEYRQKWNKDFLAYINDLNNKKPVIYCGDLNVAHEEIDLKNPKTNKKNAGFTQEERDDFTTLLNDGYIDSYRLLNPDRKDAYTFWTYMANARAKNVGWRLDYYVLSKSLEKDIVDNEIRSSVMGSDHCPIVLTMAMT